MFQPSDFLLPAEKLPLFLQLSHYYLVRSVSYTDHFIQIVKDSQNLLNNSAAFLQQVHGTHENMISMFDAMSAAVDSDNTGLLTALSTEIQQWVCELLEELSGLRKRWEAFDAALTEIDGRTNQAKNRVVQADNDLMIDCFTEMIPDLEVNLKGGSEFLNEAASLPQDILCFLQDLYTQLRARQQEWRKIQVFLNCQNPNIQQDIKTSKENWDQLASQCLMLKKGFAERRINEIYKQVLHRDPQNVTMAQWNVMKEIILDQINKLKTQPST